MKALIIEDEKPAADKLIRMLRQLDASIEIVGVLESVQQSINWFKSNPLPDIIFMDIQLDDGISFDIFEAVQIEAPIIFTTAYDEYALRAFKVISVDYLLKPIEMEALTTAVNKYKSVHNNPLSDRKMSQIYEELGKRYKSRFFIRIGTQYKSIAVEDIECFYIRERAVFIRTFSDHNYDLDFSLEQILQMVDPSQFFRVNRNYIINLKAIVDIHIYSTSRLKLKLVNKEDDEVIVSREKVAEFKNWLDR